jgi:hypothetical protein
MLFNLLGPETSQEVLIKTDAEKPQQRKRRTTAEAKSARARKRKTSRE